MESRNFTCPLVLLMLLGATTLPASPQIEPEEPISIDLEAADLQETLQSFAVISGSRLDLEDGIEGEVTLTVEKAPWGEILNSVCAAHGLVCESLLGVGDAPPVLRVRRASAGPPPGFHPSINLALSKASASEVLNVFQIIAGTDLPIEVDPAISGDLTLYAEAVPWPRMLEEICRLVGCRVVWSEGKVRVEAISEEAKLLDRMDLKMPNMAPETILAAIAKASVFGGDGELEVVGDLGENLTLDLHAAAWSDAVATVCVQAACDWKVRYGARPLLRVRAQGAVLATPADGIFSPKPPQGAPPPTLAYRLTGPGNALHAGVARFRWGAPVHAASVGDRQVRLVWIPLDAATRIVLPILVRCDGASREAELFDAVPLPLAAEARRTVGETGLVLRPAEPDADVAGSEPMASCGEWGKVMVTASAPVTAEGAAGKSFRHPLPTHPGAYLLVTPSGRQSAAALVSLGRDREGAPRFVLVRASADGIEVKAVQVGEAFHASFGETALGFEIVLP